MNLKYLKSVVVADSYAAMHPYMMKEYFQNFEKEKKKYPPEFVAHYRENGEYHDWIMNSFELVNVNNDDEAPSLFITLSFREEKVRLRFGGLDEFRMEGDYTEGYAGGHADFLIMLALGYDQKRFTACLSFQELDVQIRAKYFQWCRLP